MRVTWLKFITLNRDMLTFEREVSQVLSRHGETLIPSAFVCWVQETR